MNAPARGPAAPADLRQRHGVETPEHVDVHLELAGLGSRTAAAFVDMALLTLGFIVFAWVAERLDVGGAIGSVAEGWAAAFAILLVDFALLAYFTLCEGLNGGRTLGKQALGLRVVMDTGRPVTFTAALVRNLVRLIDCFFPLLPILPALLFIFLHKSNKRLGDLAAGTIVVRDRPSDWSLAPVAAAHTVAEEPVETGPPELSEDEFRLLDRFLARMHELDPPVQVRMTVELARRFEQRGGGGVPRRTPDAQAYLVQLFAEEQRKRRSRFATRARTEGGGGAIGRTTVTAERFVAQKREGWEAFRAVATRVERSGVGALPGPEIPGFAARYREAAADLARARTYGVDPRVIEYLERLVSAGHNALYRAWGRRRTPVLRYLARDFPAAVVLSWRYVLTGFLLFAVPAAVGYVMIRERPALADEVLPSVMVSRAEQAAERQARGVGYAEAGAEERPVIAAAIISNNILVSFWAFVGGLLAGTLTVWVLVMNGLAIGMGFGLFVNYRAGSYLATFVAAHGVLELAAVFISAGAGFRLAQALIAPGDRTRRDALVVEGMVAARMIGAVVTLLAIAGAIEGLLSASDAAAEIKYGVSAGTGALLVLYLWNGGVYLREQGARSSSIR